MTHKIKMKVMMRKLLYIVGCLFLSIAVSCISKEEKEKRSTEKLEKDREVLKDARRSIIYRIDSSQIETLELNKKIQALMDSASVTGLAISIFNNNQNIYREAFGYANFDTKTKLQINHSFYGASLSKAVFGYLLANLVADGVIDLDKPLQQYLNFPLYQLKSVDKWRGFQDLQHDKRYENITARMCMSHTTGFQNWRRIDRPGNSENDKKLRIFFEPGTECFYSGEGMMLLQYVIEHITGRGLEDLAQEKVFKPLQMQNTSYLWQERFTDMYCNGHTTKQKVIEKDKRDKSQAAGSMETSLIDYTVFAKHLLELYREKSEITDMLFHPSFRIRTIAQFGPMSLKKTTEYDSIQLSYALGWGRLQSPFGPGVFKEGHGEGFQHYTILFPEQEMGILILSNSDNAESIFKELLEIAMADTYTPWKWENYIPYQLKD